MNSQERVSDWAFPRKFAFSFHYITDCTALFFLTKLQKNIFTSVLIPQFPNDTLLHKQQEFLNTGAYDMFKTEFLKCLNQKF